MFYDEAKAIKACEEEPSLIFELIREEHYELVDFLLTKKKVDINICDELGNNVLVRLLKKGQYDLVLKHMKNKKWDVNHQNNDGDTFAHILVLYNYVNVLEIINGLKKNKNLYSIKDSMQRQYASLSQYVGGGRYFELYPEEKIRSFGKVIYESEDAQPYVRSGKKIGRNEPCPCGSGKKYKQCCMNKEK